MALLCHTQATSLVVSAARLRITPRLIPSQTTSDSGPGEKANSHICFMLHAAGQRSALIHSENHGFLVYFSANNIQCAFHVSLSLRRTERHERPLTLPLHLLLGDGVRVDDAFCDEDIAGRPILLVHGHLLQRVQDVEPVDDPVAAVVTLSGIGAAKGAAVSANQQQNTTYIKSHYAGHHRQKTENSVQIYGRLLVCVRLLPWSGHTCRRQGRCRPRKCSWRT